MVWSLRGFSQKAKDVSTTAAAVVIVMAAISLPKQVKAIEETVVKKADITTVEEHYREQTEYKEANQTQHFEMQQSVRDLAANVDKYVAVSEEIQKAGAEREKILIKLLTEQRASNGD